MNFFDSTETVINAKTSVFVICVETIIYICYCIVCMTLPLPVTKLKWIWNKNANMGHNLKDIFLRKLK